MYPNNSLPELESKVYLTTIVEQDLCMVKEIDLNQKSI